MSEYKITVPTCTDCGACCEKAWHVEVYTWLDDVPLRYVKHEVDGSYMRQKKSGACAAWDSQTRKCKIYKRRPLTCRQFGRGDPLCLGVIATLRPEFITTIEGGADAQRQRRTSRRSQPSPEQLEGAQTIGEGG